ncbi:MAG: alpha/beta hydrolase domain-containing protein [Acetobacteraceae bacterium]
MRRIPLALTAALCLLPALAAARVTALDIIAQEDFAGGASFGAAGSYTRIRAVAHGELDPADPANAVILDLDRAPRTAAGMVAYDADVFILRPKDPAKASGVMLYDVPNRGNKFALSWLDDAPDSGSANDPRTLQDAGNGFTFRRGYSMVWSGWQPEAAAPNSLSIRVPVALDHGKPITRRIRFEMVAGTRGPETVRSVALPYPVATPDTARLTVRARQADPETEVPRTGWAFDKAGAVHLLPEGTAFPPRQIFELTYEATAPTVDGIGMAAVRDVVAYLRRQPAVAGPVQHTLGFGVSLSGRFLRNFIELGMNRDEAGQRVFDGVLPHIGGAGKVFDNFEFAMPGRTATQHEDRFYPENWFPFADFAATDPMTGQTARLPRGDGSDPLILQTNTSTEYWQKGASLIHTDPADGADRALPPGSRAYLVAGTQHGGHAGSGTAPGPCANPRNPHSAGPALRALLVALEQWVVDGVKPPDSRVPRRADGTGVDPAAVHLPALPGVTWTPGANPIGPPVDWTNPPATVTRAYPALVSAIDADGNEVAGIRLPDIAVPLGTYTGTNVYRDYPTEMCDRDGTFIPFARDAAERARTGDPRPSLQERYGSREAYVARVRAAAQALVADRLLLAEDADAAVRAAAATDRF